MGTYSQPSRILDTSLSEFAKGVSDATSKALQTATVRKKQEDQLKLQYLKLQQKEAEREAKKREKRGQAVGKEIVEDVEEIRKGIGVTDLALTPPINQDYILLDPNAQRPTTTIPTTTGVGVPIDEQFKSLITSEWKGLIDVEPGSDEDIATKNLINRDKAEGISLLAALNATSEKLNIGDPNSPFDLEGNLIKPNRGQSGVLLYMDDPQLQTKVNFARDYTLGKDERFTLNSNEKELYIDYNDPIAGTVRLNNQSLTKGIKSTGSGLIYTTDSDSYTAWLDGLKKASNVNFRGITETQTTVETDEDRRRRVVTKVKNFDQAKAKLRDFVDNYIDTNGLKSNKSLTFAQNNWQMMGGPNPDDAKTYSWKATDKQKETAKKQLYLELEKKYFQDGVAINVTEEEKANAYNIMAQEQIESGALRLNALDDKVTTFKDKYFPGPIAVDTAGDYDIGFRTVFDNYNKLRDNNQRGAVDLLNLYRGEGAYANGKDIKKLMASAEVVDEQGNEVTNVEDDVIYKKSGNRYIAIPSLGSRYNFMLELDKVNPLTTPSVTRRALTMLEEENKVDANATPPLPGT